LALLAIICRAFGAAGYHMSRLWRCWLSYVAPLVLLGYRMSRLWRFLAVGAIRI
jgi:hypothetical protein